MNTLKTATVVVITALALTACGSATTGSTDKDALPQETTTSAPAETTEEPAEAAPKASTCDRVREAFLTGSAKEQVAALKALIKDKKADATAREYADYYLNRDKGDPTLQEMDRTLIVSACQL